MAAPSPSRILIVDDHAQMRGFIRAMVAESGWDAVEASNGREAVDLSESETLDLVVMDIEMPEMDGIEATREILRLHPETRV